MTFSISKMLKDGLEAFCKHIGFWVTTILIMQLMIMGLLSLGSVLQIDHSLYVEMVYKDQVLIISSLQAYLPKLFSDPLPAVISLLFYVLLVCISSYFWVVWFSASIDIFKHGRSDWISFRSILQFLPALLGVVLFSVLGGVFLGLLFGTLLYVLHALSLFSMLNLTILYLPSIVVFWYFIYRFWFVMPNILTNNKVIESFQFSWNKTKQLGLKGLVAFTIVIGAHQALFHIPDFFPFEYSLLGAVVHVLYSDLILILVVLMHVAAWHQVYDTKEIAL